jgi:hypothetical protein
VEILNYFQTMGTNAILEGFSMNMGNVEMGDPARAIHARLGEAIRRGRRYICGVKFLRTTRSGGRPCVPWKTRFGFGGSKWRLKTFFGF